MSSTIKLDVERSLRYDFHSILKLDELDGINLMSPATYKDFSPKQVVALVWAGQLHTPQPLTRAEVAKRIPSNVDAYLGVINAIATAIAEALDRPVDDAK